MSESKRDATPALRALLDENRRFEPQAAFREAARVNDPAVHERAAADPVGFWAGFAAELEWSEPWRAPLEGEGPEARWFVGGKTQCVSVNCIDRHLLHGRGATKAALIWEGEPGERTTC